MTNETNDERNNDDEREEENVRLRDTQEELVRVSFREEGHGPYIHDDLVPVF